MISQNMLNFMAKNKKVKIIQGEHRTPDNRPVKTNKDLEESDRFLYLFEDGEKIELMKADARTAPDFKPNWAI